MTMIFRKSLGVLAQIILLALQITDIFTYPCFANGKNTRLLMM